MVAVVVDPVPLAPPLVPVPDVGTDELSPSAVVVNGPEPGPDPDNWLLPPLFGGCC